MKLEWIFFLVFQRLCSLYPQRCARIQSVMDNLAGFFCEWEYDRSSFTCTNHNRSLFTTLITNYIALPTSDCNIHLPAPHSAIRPHAVEEQIISHPGFLSSVTNKAPPILGHALYAACRFFISANWENLTLSHTQRVDRLRGIVPSVLNFHFASKSSFSNDEPFHVSGAFLEMRFK